MRAAVRGVRRRRGEAGDESRCEGGENAERGEGKQEMRAAVRGVRRQRGVRGSRR